MPEYIDLHTHILSQTDDGAEDSAQMLAMLDMAYADGIRGICATPHYWPGQFGENSEAADRAFDDLKAYAQKYPDLTLFRGNELYCTQETLKAVDSGQCHRLADGRYLLLEFEPDISFFGMRAALSAAAAKGILPLLAHTERYGCLYKSSERLAALQTEIGVCFQVNASSLFGAWGRRCAHFARYLINQGFAHVIASDAHDTKHRPPTLGQAYAHVARRYGQRTAQILFCDNPRKILEGKGVINGKQ